MYSEIFAANCETQSAGEGSFIALGTWITYDSKLSNLERPKFESPTLRV